MKVCQNIAFLAAQLTTAIGEFYKMDSLVATNDRSKVSDAKNANAVLVPSLNTELTQKEYNAIYYNYAYYGTLTAQELSDLTNLAQLCPYTDGSAVFQARALLSRFDSTEYVNACEYDASMNSRFMNAESGVNLDLISINTMVFPNPASNQLNISTEAENAIIVIYNVLGQKVLEQKLDALTTLNFERLSSGTYLYKIVDSNDKTIKSDKLLISK